MSIVGAVPEVGRRLTNEILLPLPFVKGRPVDYNRMSVDQLKRFIPFMYKCQYNSSLPAMERNGASKPSWWPDSVSFSKNLTVDQKSSQNQKGMLQRQIKELTTLVRKCYELNGAGPLLALAREVATGKDYVVRRESNATRIEFASSPRKLLVQVDEKNVTYDQPNPGRERGVFIEVGCQENVGAKREKSLKTRQDVTQKPAKLKQTLKRKIVEEETVYCQYCRKGFKIKDFCEDHEEQCMERPLLRTKEEDEKNALFSALGLRDPAKPEAVEEPDSAASEDPAVARAKKAHLLKIVKNNPFLPLTTNAGEKLIQRLNGKVHPQFPPEFESHCVPKSGLPFNLKEDHTCVTKKAILKNSEFPHLYSFNRQQRLLRQQELAIGLKKKCWKDLNAVSLKVSMKLSKINPHVKKIKVQPNTKSYLSRKWKLAKSCKVRIVDFREYPSLLPDDVQTFLAENCPTI